MFQNIISCSTAVLFLFVSGCSTLQTGSMNKDTITIKLSGNEGSEVYSLIHYDRNAVSEHVSLPKSYSFKANTLDFSFALTDYSNAKEFTVEVIRNEFYHKTKGRGISGAVEKKRQSSFLSNKINTDVTFKKLTENEIKALLHQ